MFAKGVADRNHKLPYRNIVGRSQWQRSYAGRKGFHLDRGEVAVGIGSDHAGGTPLAVGKDDLERAGAFYDMIVGNNVPLIVVDKARTAADGGVNNVDDGWVCLRVELDQSILQCEVAAHARRSRVSHRMAWRRRRRGWQDDGLITRLCGRGRNLLAAAPTEDDGEH